MNKRILKPKSLHPFGRLLLFVLIAVITSLVVFSFSSKKAHAVLLSAIPIDVQNYYNYYDNDSFGHPHCFSGNSYVRQADQVWAFPNPGNSANDGSPQSPIVVNPSVTMNLQIASLSFVCQDFTQNHQPFNYVDGADSALSVGPDQLVQETKTFFGIPRIISGPVTPVGLINGSNPQTIDYQGGTRYWFPNNQTTIFSYTPPSASQIGNGVQVQIDIPVNQANRYFQPGGNSADPFDPPGYPWIYTCTLPIQPLHWIDEVSYNTNNYVFQCSQGDIILTINIKQPGTPPTISNVTPNCSNENITGNIKGTAPIWATYTINGQTQNIPGGLDPFTIPMNTYDQFKSYNVRITAANSLGTVFKDVTYGPCYTPQCGTAVVNNNQPITANQPNVPVQVTIGLSGGNPSGKTIGGSVVIHFNTLTSPPLAVSQSGVPVTANFQGPSNDTSPTIWWSFSDDPPPPEPLGHCPYTLPPPEVDYKPYMQVNGGDVLAGNKLSNNSGTVTCNSSSDGAYGWNQLAPSDNIGSQFAVQAIGPIDGFASSTTSISGIPQAGSPNGLAFANDNNPPLNTPYPNYSGDQYGGGFTSMPCPSYYNVPTSAIPYSGSLNSISSNGTYVISGNYTIGTTTISKQLTVYVNGDVTITGNGVSYAPYSSLANLPNLTIIASGNIIIHHSVGNIDGVYIAQQSSAGSGGEIFDCSDTNGSFAGNNQCDNKLVVNGAFLADRIDFMRTFGNIYAGSANGDGPAEVINYSPEVWLAGQGGTIPNPQCNTSPTCYSSITSLPPVL